MLKYVAGKTKSGSQALSDLKFQGVAPKIRASRIERLLQPATVPPWAGFHVHVCRCSAKCVTGLSQGKESCGTETTASVGVVHGVSWNKTWSSSGKRDLSLPLITQPLELGGCMCARSLLKTGLCDLMSQRGCCCLLVGGTDRWTGQSKQWRGEGVCIGGGHAVFFTPPSSPERLVRVLYDTPSRRYTQGCTPLPFLSYATESEILMYYLLTFFKSLLKMHLVCEA